MYFSFVAILLKFFLNNESNKMTVTYKRKYSLAMLSPLLLALDLMPQRDVPAWSPIVLDMNLSRIIW